MISRTPLPVLYRFFPLLRNVSLRTWLTASVTGSILFAVVACVMLTERFAQAHAERRAVDALRQMASDLRDNLDRGMEQHLGELVALSGLDQVRQLDRPADIRRVLDQLQLSFPRFAWLGVADPSGRVLAGAGGLLEGASVAQRPWFRAGLENIYVGDVHEAVLLAKLLPPQQEPWRFVDFAVPLQDASGRTIAVLGGHLSWQWARQLQEELLEPSLRDRSIRVLLRARDGKPILGLPTQDARPQVSVQIPTQGRGRYGGLGWAVVVEQPLEVALEDYFQLRRQIALSAVGLLLAIAPLAWWLSRRLTAPLQALTDAIAKQQHLSAESMPSVGGYREVRLLSDELRSLAARQAEQDQHLRELNASLEQRVQERTEELTRLNSGLQAAMRRLAVSEHRLRDVSNNLPAVVAYFNRDEICEFANDRALQVHGVESATGSGFSLRSALGEQRYAEYLPHLKGVLEGRKVRFEGRVRVEEHEVDFQSHFIPDRDADGRVAGFYIMSFDISAQKSAQRLSAASAHRLKTITDNLPVLISYIDKDLRLQFSNGTFKEWMGLDPTDMLGRPLPEIIGPVLFAQREHYLQRALAGERVEFEVASEAQGVQRDLQNIYVPDVRPDGSVEGLFSLSSDVTAMKLVERHLEQLTRVDALTGLPNRRQLEERMPQAIARARRSGRPMALMFLDIDRFKAINDTHGHGLGDEVIKAFGHRLAASVRSTDTVARLAGDEFVVLLESLNSAEEPQFVARKILSVISGVGEVGGTPLRLSTSIGIAIYEGGDTSAQQLLAEADGALYKAKAAGRNTYRVAPRSSAASLSAT